MPITFHYSKRPPLNPLTSVTIPERGGINNDSDAVVFNPDPRLQESKCSKAHKMAPREGGFLDSLRASFSSKSLKTDSTINSRSTTHPKNDRRKSEKARERERERDLSFVILPRSASSLIPGKSSNTTNSMPPPPVLPLLWRGDKLPKHANIFTGIPTPTDSAVTSAGNSQHVPSKPSTPTHEHSLRPSRSVPDWTSEQRKQYCYFEDASENKLPRMPSAYKSQPALNLGAVEQVETLEVGVGGREISQANSPKLSSIGRYKKQKVAALSGDESSRQQRSSMKSPKSLYIIGDDETQEKETPSPFLGAREGLNPTSPPVHKQLQQQRSDHCPNSQNPLSQSVHQVHCRSIPLVGAADGDQRHTLSTSQHRPDRPTSTSTYQTHRGHPLYPVVEETPSSLPLQKWGGDWSPHLQQGSELFFETGMGVNLGGSVSPVLGTSPLAEMGIPSPQTKKRPASWACPIRPTVGVGFDLARSSKARHSHELDILFPPTPPSSTGDVWDDGHNSLDTGPKDCNLSRDLLRHSWNVFILIWALLLIFKSVQFVMTVTEILIMEPIKFLCNILKNFAEG